ncbi:MAG: hypothetical protein NTZ65_03615 [Candidatus Berkelbacteria bacterium]|nr:hypothetical protein [Candidatus Berkelbacteria bacterium]
MMKRVWEKEDGWVRVGGESAMDGGSTGSYEIGWLKLPGATPNPPPSPSTPKPAIKVEQVVISAWDAHRVLRLLSKRGRALNWIALVRPSGFGKVKTARRIAVLWRSRGEGRSRSTTPRP